MTKASSSSHEPKSLIEDSSASDVDQLRTQSANSSSKSERESYFDQQRQGRRSRPINKSSPLAARRSESYTEPPDWANLNENVVSPPVENPDEKSEYRNQVYLEDLRRQNRSAAPKEARNFSRSPTGAGARRRTSGAENLSENAAPPPIGDPSESSTHRFKTRYLDDEVERPDSVEVAEPPPFVSKLATDSLPKDPGQDQANKFVTELYTVSYLTFFSILGTLARLGVQWLTFYPGAPVVTPVLWANFAGSLFMGFLSEDRQMFRDEWGFSRSHPDRREKREKDIDSDQKAFAKAHGKVKKTIPLYIGLTTGFCGSFTSFSSFARDGFLALSNDLPTPINHPYQSATTISTTSTVHRNPGFSVEALLAVIILTTALSLSALKIGAHMALFLEPVLPTLPFTFTRRVLDRLGVFLALGCWLGAVFLAVWPPDRPGGPSSRGSWVNETWRGEVLFAIVFAPAGCLLRFYASIKLNGLVPAFPLGTFAVNMLGTAIEGMCFNIQHVGVGVGGEAGGGRVGCQVLEGVMDGFCGCLTTVSTWVAELQSLRRRHAYYYGLASVAGGLCLMVVIMGSVRWSVGFREPACVV